MEGRVIPLPTARALGTVPPAEQERREQIALLSVELASAVAGPTELPLDAEGRVHERCVRAALVVAGRRGASLMLAGTSAHPIVEARFVGEGAADRAVHAAREIAEAIPESQRSGEIALEVRMGIGVGSVSQTPSGVRITRGSPSRVADRLRERADEGVLLAGGGGARGPAEYLGGVRQPGLTLDAGSPEVPVWRLSVGTSETP